MPLFRLNDIHLAYGPNVLLDKVSLSIDKGERIALLGRNGAGKSSFLKLLNGQVQPDAGELWQSPDCSVAYLDQELPRIQSESVYDFILGGMAEAGQLLQDFHHLTQAEPDKSTMRKLDALQKRIDAIDAWSLQQKVDAAISRLGLHPDTRPDTLSGGWLRRLALARALVSEPDMLLLDEPTNHLDIPTIQWLEQEIAQFAGAVLLITHDRGFLQNVASKIMVLDRGEIHAWECDYQRFLVYREQQLAAEEKSRAEFDKKLAQEEVWIRQGIKARRTRNEGRVRALQALREEFSQRRGQLGKAKMDISRAELSGKIVVEAENIHQSFDGKIVIDDFSTRIMRGDKIGLIGENGAGKSTLLKILLGEMTPERGKVKIGTKMAVAYFDQFRQILDPRQRVYDSLAEGSDYVEIQGKPRHVMSYLQDFLFTPDRARQKIGSLSGGEQNRLILARLFSKPANVLVLDEPTNDLDIETLELLEELLLSFEGTVLLASHDRKFLDNVVGSSIVFEGQGRVEQYVGGYQDWLDKGGSFQSEQNTRSGKAGNKQQARSNTPPTADKKKSADKLSYKLQRELEQLPAMIEKTESEIARLEQELATADFTNPADEATSKMLEQLSQAQNRLEEYFRRWEEIENAQQA